MNITRRQFMVGCSTAIAAMAGGRIGNMVFANHAAQPTVVNNEILVVVFLRGGCDGLSLVSPYDDAIYVEKRRGLKIPAPGTVGALAIDPRNASYSSSFGLHPKGGPLKELYDGNSLAIVHACGLNDDTRSHFDAMDYIERGTPGNKGTASGWLSRHIHSSANDDLHLPTLSAGSSAPASLLGDGNAVALNSPRDFDIATNNRYDTSIYLSLKKIYASGTSAIHTAGKRTIETIDTLIGTPEYVPDPNLIYPYPNNGFGNSLKTIAQTIKLDMGLRVATVDLGGWDTHENQGDNGEGYFATLVDTLARGLHAFYNDLPNHQSQLTVVVMSEFGRRLGVNTSGGTDHGHGNAMLVLGGKVNGGKLYGTWPGLLDLDQKQDLKITTDYRTVLSEIVMRRLGNAKLGTVFPGIKEPGSLGTAATDYSFQYKPLDIVGTSTDDLPIDYTSSLFQTHLPLVMR